MLSVPVRFPVTHVEVNCTMDKDAVLTHILKPKGTSTLLGGEQPINVINNNKYIPPLTSEAHATDRNVEDSLLSLDSAILTALSSECKTVVLVGPEGSGKTTTLQRLVLDWAKGQHLQNYMFVFHFRFRELKYLNKILSLETLLLHHHGLIQSESLPSVLQNPEKVLFVFDDLDHCKQSLDPSTQTLCPSTLKAVSMSCLVASLLHGSLMKGATFAVASRPTESLKFIGGTQMEVLGFLKPQREAYFKGFFADLGAANEALQHMERTLGFYDISTSPRFCWTVCSIYKSLMDAEAKLPETVSQLYADILVYLIQTLSLSKECNRELVLALGRMASHCFTNQQLSCYQEEIDAFGFQHLLTSVGVFLQVDLEHSSTPVLSFHSQLMQEFLLAVSFFLDESTSEGAEKMLEKHTGVQFLDGFLSALSGPIQRQPLETLLGNFNSDQIIDFKSWFKRSSEVTLRGCYKEKHHRYFRLLHQAQNESLVKDIVTPSARLGISYGDLSLQDCVTLNYVVTCLGGMEFLNLYHTRNLSEEQVERLAPSMSLSQKINLSNCCLSTGAVPHMASALSRGSTKELNLSNSRLGDEKFKILCAGLKDSKLHSMNLVVCRLTKASCEDLASVLISGTPQLCVLDLRHNEIGDEGLISLCKALQSPLCKLQELLVQGNGLTAASMEALSAALCSGQSELRKLDLTNNTIGDRGVEVLCKALQHPLSKLKGLKLFDSELTGTCCPYFKEALMSEHCSLSELELSVNDLGQEGALLLCQALSRPECPVENLGLKRCELTVAVFKELGSVLKSGTSKLKSLIIGINKVGNKGVKHLSDAIAHPNCLLEELDVEMSGLTDACVEDLCAAIRASRTLKSLELRNNLLTDASVPALVQVMQDSPNMLEMNLKYNDFSEDVFDMLEECDRIRY
ncbi:NACHT, LRR and PYD domains-containing protein 3 [Notolabrus celidotus]|uniref:NACHT, LRR and PYD domains-containing protein 3 n=1 Tax=Notolabrus celidotus TaxID=1203425 RepID=UPI00148F555B|nr:NACHT, LRR and PYD domains-containing protein 3 [Notolabrus celidotus]